MASRKKTPIEPWLSAKPGREEKPFIRVTKSLLSHSTWQSLPDGAKLLYLCAAVESGGKSNFTFPASTMDKYGIARPSGVRWIKELEKAGFIRCTYCGKSQMKPNEYEFTWRNWQMNQGAPLFNFRTTESPEE